MNQSVEVVEVVPPALIGGVLLAMNVVGLLANATATAVIFSRGFLGRKGPHVYKPMFSLIISNSILLVVDASYLSPVIILQKQLLSYKWRRAHSFVIQWAWDQSSVSLDLIAINRLFSVEVCRTLQQLG